LTETSERTCALSRGRGSVIILRGLIAVAFGILAFAWPGVTLSGHPGGPIPRLVFLFGLYAILHGILSIVAALGSRGRPGCGLLGTEGIVGIFAGVMTFRTGSPSPKALVFLVWQWAIATGILRIAEAIRLRKHLLGDVWLMLSGMFAAFLGGMILLRPGIGILGLASVISVFALLWGIFEVILGWEQRFGRHHGRTAIDT
jgi:uncharacterized membrane protein HdeD (DUF308 family)